MMAMTRWFSRDKYWSFPNIYFFILRGRVSALCRWSSVLFVNIFGCEISTKDDHSVPETRESIPVSLRNERVFSPCVLRSEHHLISRCDDVDINFAV
jgi:hypothetical protein